MIYSPCGTLNHNSPCMVGGKCSKRYPRALVTETITKNDGYSLYCHRSTTTNGRSTIFKVNQQDIKVHNFLIVPYSSLLSKTFKIRINVESFYSMQSIKCIYNYVTKERDMAMFEVGAENFNDQVIQYQIGHYVSNDKAIWRIFLLVIHERYPTIIHLVVHLENGQRVYFTTENALQLAN